VVRQSCKWLQYIEKAKELANWDFSTTVNSVENSLGDGALELFKNLVSYYQRRR
jgi:hypothetical protein